MMTHSDAAQILRADMTFNDTLSLLSAKNDGHCSCMGGFPDPQ